jgi:hypothetical protein
MTNSQTHVDLKIIDLNTYFKKIVVPLGQWFSTFWAPSPG